MVIFHRYVKLPEGICWSWSIIGEMDIHQPLKLGSVAVASCGSNVGSTPLPLSGAVGANINSSIYRVPSGNLLHSYWKWLIEIVDLPIDSMVIFHSYVSLPESNLAHALLILYQNMCHEYLQPFFGHILLRFGYVKGSMIDIPQIV